VQQILLAAARKVRLDGGIDMHALAQQTEGYTGADLQALIYNAQLDAIHATIDTSARVDADTVKGLVKDDVRVVEGGQPRKNMTVSEMSALKARVSEGMHVSQVCIALC
jgi:peroxin-1